MLIFVRNIDGRFRATDEHIIYCEYLRLMAFHCQYLADIMHFYVCRFNHSDTYRISMSEVHNDTLFCIYVLIILIYYFTFKTNAFNINNVINLILSLSYSGTLNYGII
jgi:hypothetical protein